MALRAFKPKTPAATGSLKLFRDVCRNVPTVLTLFDVDMTVQQARGIMKKMFVANQHISDPRTIAILNHKGRVDLQEAMLQYKTKAQIMYILEPRILTDKQMALDKEDADFFG